MTDEFLSRFAEIFPNAVEVMKAAEKAWEETVAEPVPAEFAELLRKLS